MMMMMRKSALWIGLLVVLGWSSGASALPANNPITAGLVAAYEFTGNADDVSGNGNNGVVNGATLTADRFGNVGSAYSFDGTTGNIVAMNPTGLQSTNTVSAWVKLNVFSGYQYVIDLGEPNNNWIEILPTGIFRTGNDWHPTLDTAQTSLNEWIMLTRSYDGSVMRAYLNGTPVGSLINPQSIDPTKITIGSSGVANSFLNGSIDDVYIYDRALSPTEVSTLYSVVPEPSTALLLGIGLVGLGVKRRQRPRGASHSVDGRASSW